MFRLPEKSKIYSHFFLKCPDSCQESTLHSQFLLLVLLDPLHVQILQGDIDQCSPAMMMQSTLTSPCLKLFTITPEKDIVQIWYVLLTLTLPLSMFCEWSSQFLISFYMLWCMYACKLHLLGLNFAINWNLTSSFSICISLCIIIEIFHSELLILPDLFMAIAWL